MATVLAKPRVHKVQDTLFVQQFCFELIFFTKYARFSKCTTDQPTMGKRLWSGITNILNGLIGLAGNANAFEDRWKLEALV